MALTHVYHTNHTAQISIQKISTKQALGHAKKHNERLGDKNGNHIDTRREHLNQDLLHDNELEVAGVNFYREIVNRITGEDYDNNSINNVTKESLHYADGKKVRSDAVLAFEAEMRYPGDLVWSRLTEDGKVEPVPSDVAIDMESTKSIEEGGQGFFLYPASIDEFNDWSKTSIEFLKARFGNENVLSAELHMDEFDPHIHAIITPMYKDEKDINRLSYQRFLNGPQAFKMLQQEYADSLEHLDYHRGAKFSARINYSNMNQVRAAQAEALAATLPEDRDEAEKKYRSAILKLAQYENAEDHARVNETIRRQNKVIENKDKKIGALKEAVADLGQQLEEAQKEIRRRTCELKGLEKNNDRDLVENIYFPLQKQMVETGLEEFAKMGIDMSIDQDEQISKKLMDEIEAQYPEPELSENE